MEEGGARGHEGWRREGLGGAMEVGGVKGLGERLEGWWSIGRSFAVKGTCSMTGMVINNHVYFCRGMLVDWQR